MCNFRCILYSLVFFGLLSLTMPMNAHAYIDPGTGSFIIQVVIGVLAGALVTLKIFWGKVKIFFKIKFSKGTKP
jgi:hypothetical protein